MNSTAHSAPSDPADPLRALAIVMLVVSGITSMGLFLYAGRNRHPGAIVVVGFIAWVLSPFVLLAIAEFASKRWTNRTRSALNVLTIVLTFATLFIYGFLAFGPPTAKMVPIFVLVPPVSCIVIVVTVVVAAGLNRR